MTAEIRRAQQTSITPSVFMAVIIFQLARSGDLALWMMVSRYSCARVVLINRPNYSPGPGAGADCSISAWDKCHLSTNQKPDNGEPGPNKEM